MATKVASLYAEVGANISGLQRGLGQAKSELRGAGADFTNFGALATKMFLGVGAAAGAMIAAFKFGELGTHVEQAASSFEHMLGVVGGAPSTLQDMRDASRGTIDDMTLMANASTFLAGTTGDLGRTFADALPELTGIASAAAILNPTLGSASEAFNRLALGIKKAEPELLDELGIMINLTQVYKAYGESVGKSATDLTKAEKSQAMLNAVLGQGETLMQQAAGAANENAISVDQAQTAWTNLSNTFATKMAPASATVANAFVEMLTPMSQAVSSLGDQRAAAMGASNSYSEYRAAVSAAADAAGFYVDESGDLYNLVRNQAGVARVLVQENFALSESTYQAAKAGIALGEAAGKDAAEITRFGVVTENAAGIVADTAQSTEQLEGSLTGVAGAAGDAANATGAAVISWDKLKITAVGLAAGIEGQLGKALENYQETLSLLTTEHTALTDGLVDLQERGFSPTSKNVQDLTAAIDANKGKQGEALAGLQQFTAQLIYQQAAMGVDTTTALNMARAMGVLSEADYAVAASVEATRLSFDTNKDGMISASEGAAQFAAQVLSITAAVQSLEAQGLPITMKNIQTEMKKLTTTGAPKALDQVGEAATNADDPLTNWSDAAGGAALAAADATTQTENLTEAVGEVPTETKVAVTTRGIGQAIAALHTLRAAAEQVPQNITISANVVGGGTGTGPNFSYSGVPSLTNQAAVPGMTVNETYNVYDTLAAVMLVSTKRRQAAERLEVLMNG